MKKDKKQTQAKRSAQELIGIRELTDSGVVTAHNTELVFFLIRPVNIAVLPPGTIEAKIIAMTNVLKNTSELEIICLNSAESFDGNKTYLSQRIRQEDNPMIKELCEQDLLFLDHIQLEMATAREFILLLRLHTEHDKQNSGEKIRLEKILKEQGFEARRATREEVKRILAVYFTQNVVSEHFDEVDGERWVE